MYFASTIHSRLACVIGCTAVFTQFFEIFYTIVGCLNRCCEKAIAFNVENTTSNDITARFAFQDEAQLVNESKFCNFF